MFSTQNNSHICLKMQVLEKYMKWKPFVKQSLDSLVETETPQVLWEGWWGAFARCLLNGLLETCISEAGFKYWATLTSLLTAVWNTAENSGCLYMRPWGCGPRGSGLLAAQGCVWLVIFCLGGRPLRSWMTLTLRRKTLMSEAGQASRQKTTS